jgi:hydrogenase expression/formation protein HypC
MCVGIPARIVSSAGLYAQAVSRQGPCEVDLALTGPLPPDTWVLTFLGAAHEVIDEARARDIESALDALDAIARGETDSAAIDRYFSDLTGREPELPAHLRPLLPTTP